MSKIYLASSKPARMADTRIRIERDLDAMEPTTAFDLVFSRTSDSDKIPADAIYTWQTTFAGMLFYFYTTDARASEFLGKDYSLDKLREAMENEKRLWLAWAEGNVYRVIIESWGAEQRDWLLEDVASGCYGASQAIAVAEEFKINSRDFDLPSADLVCCDDELAPEFGVE